MRGKIMLRARKDMHSQQHYILEHFDFYDRNDDPV
jgi:hypothetical protein